MKTVLISIVLYACVSRFMASSERGKVDWQTCLMKLIYKYSVPKKKNNISVTSKVWQLHNLNFVYICNEIVYLTKSLSKKMFNFSQGIALFNFFWIPNLDRWCKKCEFSIILTHCIMHEKYYIRLDIYHVYWLRELFCMIIVL